MKVLALNTNDLSGGAARAASRLHRGLRLIGIDSRLMVQYKTGGEPGVVGPQRLVRKQLEMLRPHLDQLPLRFYPRRQQVPWSVGWMPNPFLRFEAIPDLVHLHWVSGGYVPNGALPKLGCPLVWTFHDMAAFTGGCHYAGECTRYTESCGACPQLASSRKNDLSHWIWRRKEKLWKELDLTVVTPSRWLAECAKASSLLKDVRVEVIPNGVDLEVFKPVTREIARQILGLPADKRLILFGAMDATSDPRKGFVHLENALRTMVSEGWAEKAEVVVFGTSRDDGYLDCGMFARYLGSFQDDVSLGLVYAAADVFVAPSLEDNLPNTIMEAMACGTPCAAFDIGGIPDMIDHQENGYLARPFEPEGLARGIAWMIESPERQLQLGAQARCKAEQNWRIEDVARRYEVLYREILERRGEGQLR